MADDKPLKSSLELAMERLKKKDADAGVESRPLTDAQKAAIAEARNFYESKLRASAIAAFCASVSGREIGRAHV